MYHAGGPSGGFRSCLEVVEQERLHRQRSSERVAERSEVGREERDVTVTDEVTYYVVPDCIQFVYSN